MSICRLIIYPGTAVSGLEPTNFTVTSFEDWYDIMKTEGQFMFSLSSKPSISKWIGTEQKFNWLQDLFLVAFSTFAFLTKFVIGHFSYITLLMFVMTLFVSVKNFTKTISDQSDMSAVISDPQDTVSGKNAQIYIRKVTPPEWKLGLENFPNFALLIALVQFHPCGMELWGDPLHALCGQFLVHKDSHRDVKEVCKLSQEIC
ncbi:unnamed protein product [Orchesella dallaii]|uniref:Reticulon-like protein n=1 Tax=Orchesella dallaii TaxID=48710 RepID=A0ABP1SA05_9HEXA